MKTEFLDKRLERLEQLNLLRNLDFEEEQELAEIKRIKQLIIDSVSQRSELYFAFMEEYNALMGESEHQILKEEVVVLLAKYCG